MAFSPMIDRLSSSPMTSAPGYFHLHLISDSTGETLITVARAAAAQYARIMQVEHVHPLVRTQKQLDRVLTEIEETPGIDQLAAQQVTGATRIVQEAFTNAMKHSRATEMHLRVGKSLERAIQVSITDNGCGFDVTAQHRGEGLKSMRKRAASIGGSLDVRSRPGETCIVLGLLSLST